MIEREVATDGSVTWRARQDGTVVGTATIRPGSDVTARYVRLSVEPAHRRRGIGTRLLEAALAEARAEGRAALESVVDDGSPGEAFARAHGAYVGDELVRMTLDLRRAVPVTYQLPEGCRLVHWWDETPEVWLNSYADTRRHLRDAPNAYAPPVRGRTPEEIRELEATRSGSLLTVAAVHHPPGRDGAEPFVVACTELAVPDGSGIDQLDTVVRTGYRRRGLGTAVKAEAVARLRVRRPDAATLTTTTAATNTGMRAVNRRLGFVEIGHRKLFRLVFG